jgi:CheY-like chemotaxis protein
VKKSDQRRLFSGKHILIVEDEYFLADETRRKLEDLGAIVIGPTSSARRAFELLDQEHIDAAILDVSLGDQPLLALADGLDARDINFVFATRYDPTLIPVKYKGFVLCEKPSSLEQIALALFGPDDGLDI